MNTIVNDLIARQRVEEAVRAARMQHRWVSLFGDETIDAPARRSRAVEKGRLRWFGWGKPERAAS